MVRKDETMGTQLRHPVMPVVQHVFCRGQTEDQEAYGGAKKSPSNSKPLGHDSLTGLLCIAALCSNGMQLQQKMGGGSAGHKKRRDEAKSRVFFFRQLLGN